MKAMNALQDRSARLFKSEQRLILGVTMLAVILTYCAMFGAR